MNRVRQFQLMRDSREIASSLLLPTAFLLLVFALRLWHLDFRPLWWDEGLTLTFSRLAPADNASFAVATEDVNPPLYRWFVGGLTALVGTNVFTARLANVFAGTFAAAAFYALVRQAFGRQSAYWSLLLLAIAPMQIYYAQEAKGYAFTAAAVLLGVLLWFRLHRWLLVAQPQAPKESGWIIWLALAITFALALGANYLAILGYVTLILFSLALSICALSLGLGIRALLTHWARLLSALMVGGLVLLPFVWATFGGTTAGLNSTSGGLIRYGPLTYLWLFLRAFAAGERNYGLLNSALTILLFLLAAIGFLATFRSSRKWGAWFFLSWITVPLVLGYAFHLRFPWFFPRFLLYAQVGLLALAGSGLVAFSKAPGQRAPNRRRLLQMSMGLLVVALSLAAVFPHYTAPSKNEDDIHWPDLFQILADYGQADDLVIARLPWMPGYMYAYLPPAVLPDWVLGFFDAPNIDAELRPLLDDYDRLWQIDYMADPFNPPADTVQWLLGKAALVLTTHSGPGTLSLFVDRNSLAAQGQTESLATGFENGVRLTWQAADYVAHPGDAVGLVLIWETDTRLDTRLVRFVHLIDSEGQLITQSDAEPVLGYSPTYAWLPGDEVVDPVALLLPLDIPPGEYRLLTGLYDRDTLERIPVKIGEDHLVTGTITVPPR